MSTRFAHNVRTMYLKIKEIKSPYYIPHKKKTHSPKKNIYISYTNSLPKNMTTLISKLLSFFVTNDKGQVTQAVILILIIVIIVGVTIIVLVLRCL